MTTDWQREETPEEKMKRVLEVKEIIENQHGDTKIMTMDWTKPKFEIEKTSPGIVIFVKLSPNDILDIFKNMTDEERQQIIIEIFCRNDSFANNDILIFLQEWKDDEDYQKKNT